MKLIDSAPPRLTRAPAEERRAPPRRRPLWQLRLIEAEGGFRLGLRASSILYVHLFAVSLVALSGAVLGLSLIEWVLIGLCAAAVVSAELFNAALQALAAQLADAAPDASRRAARLATAATVTTLLAALGTAIALLGQKLSGLFT